LPKHQNLKLKKREKKKREVVALRELLLSSWLVMYRVPGRNRKVLSVEMSMHTQKSVYCTMIFNSVGHELPICCSGAAKVHD
jgi:hypothetical protein